ncbi:hypothetical protein CJ030_MR1G008998 [Morella rubra]|uniref:Uncharacterized protein n=1 Tax=Morella rubra TaxID=262757 RepID=A0A6A1WIY5_9ROSI|nr:hypothetical protein CJ030_MR1G008998 [Morella rubra]
MESSLEQSLMKVAMFVLVQALVFLILSKSSSVFSKTKRSLSFRTPRSLTINRILSALGDMPAGGESSPAYSRSLQYSPSKKIEDGNDLTS